PTRLTDRAGMRGADDGADTGESVFSDEVLAPFCDQPRDVLPEHAAVAQPDVLDVAATFVRGLDQAEDAAAVAAAGAEERLERVAPEIRVHGHRVGDRGIAFEVGRRIGSSSRADIAALRVRDHEPACRPGVLAGSLEGAQ